MAMRRVFVPNGRIPSVRRTGIQVSGEPEVFEAHIVETF
jgi:hypothetical protein